MDRQVGVIILLILASIFGFDFISSFLYPWPAVKFFGIDVIGFLFAIKQVLSLSIFLFFLLLAHHVLQMNSTKRKSKS